MCSRKITEKYADWKTERYLWFFPFNAAIFSSSPMCFLSWIRNVSNNSFFFILLSDDLLIPFIEWCTLKIIHEAKTISVPLYIAIVALCCIGINSKTKKKIKNIFRKKEKWNRENNISTMFSKKLMIHANAVNNF